MTVINIARSLKRGVVAGPDPWNANTLEWFTTSPPPANNFDVIPLVRSVEPMKDIRREIERRSVRGPRRRLGDRARRGQAGGDLGGRSAHRRDRRPRPPGARLAHPPAAERPARADQAEGPVAAAADHGGEHVRGRRPLDGARAADLPRGLPVGRRGRGDQPLLRPRHRRPDGPHRQPPGAGRAHPPARGAAVRMRAGGLLGGRAVAGREPARRGACRSPASSATCSSTPSG